MIRSLRIFCDLVESQSFTETGRRNYLTQSAVSQHLKSLEEKFGHRLIERGHRQITTTAPGRLVYESAQDILWRYRRLERMLERPAKEVSGPLHIAASVTVGLYELPPYLTDFIKRYPKVDLKLTYLRDRDVYEAVLAGQANVGLVPFPEPHPRLTIQLFKKDRLVIIIPPTHPWWSARKRISLKQLDTQPFIGMHAGSPTRRAVDRIFEQAKVHPNLIHEFDNIELIKRAVEVASGFSIVPRKTVTNEIQSGTLKQLEMIEGPFEHPVGIVTRKSAERSPAAQKLITALLSSREGKNKRSAPRRSGL